MKRYVEGDDRRQVALLPECVDDYIGCPHSWPVAEHYDA